MTTLKNLTIFLLLLSTPFVLNAQGAPPQTPIDGGLSLLLLSGAAYGIHAIRKAQKKH